MDISQLCRSCMKELSIWENEEVDDRTVEMFYYCTNIKVARDEKLPKQFCKDCIVKLESSYKYITDAQKTDVTLRNIISRSENSVIVEPENYNKSLMEEHYITNVSDSNANFKEEVLFNNGSECNVQSEIGRKSFVSKTWFTKHMEKEHTGQKHTCSYCQKTFPKASQLRYHITSHSNERKFPCATCGKRFKCKKQLSVHVKAHSDARPYACDKCDMRFKKSSILKCHMKVHENDKQFLCSYCGWSFSQVLFDIITNMQIETVVGEFPHVISEGLH
ncbi:hypothetical protein evm_006893 [Chilo suppressalis]|nr:hypothetical protein evm_006893 [Chilo suppressalis]